MSLQTATALMFITTVIAFIGWATYDPRAYPERKSELAKQIDKCFELYSDKQIAGLCAVFVEQGMKP